MNWMALTVIVLLVAIKVSAQVPAPENVPSYNDWTFTGCFGDNPVNRSLHNGAGSSDTMTVQTCLDICDSTGFAFGGLEFSRECYCGNTLLYGYGSSDACENACTGNSTQLCGGPNTLSVYGNGKLPLTQGPASILPSYKSSNFPFFRVFNATRCWKEGTSTQNPGGRLLPDRPTRRPIQTEEMTVEKCIDACDFDGREIAGLMFGQECWCGNSIFPLGQLAGDDECDMPCLMNATESCGGPDRLLVYTSLSIDPIVLQP